jgi:formin 2
VARVGLTDRFMMQMLGVPHCAARFRCLSLQKRFQAAHLETCSQVALLEHACDDVKGSARLKKLLSVILKIGNKLNAGSNQVAAFTLDSLMKLKDAKVNGGS